MTFRKKYPITAKFLTANSKRRSGAKTNEIKFIVAHDTGNPSSTAKNNVDYYERTRNDQYAAAHFFVDDKEILECIPAVSEDTEKAAHVKRRRVEDNLLYGDDANDVAIGVEYCFGNNIDADEAYSKYVWLLAYLCYYFKLNPTISIVGHFILDYHDRTDPIFGLAHSGRDYGNLLKDVAQEYYECINKGTSDYNFVEEKAIKTVRTRLNIRKQMPSVKASISKTVNAGTELEVLGYATDGQSISGNSKWYKLSNGDYFWSGGVY